MRTEKQRTHHRLYMRKYNSIHREKIRANEIKYHYNLVHYRHDDYIKQGRRNRQRIRTEINSFFGGQCECKYSNCWHIGHCRIRDFRILQMDHVNGGGRNKINGRHNSLYTRHAFIRNDPKRARKEFQLLCVGCNWIKRWENKEYAKWYKSKAE